MGIMKLPIWKEMQRQLEEYIIRLTKILLFKSQIKLKQERILWGSAGVKEFALDELPWENAS